MTKYQNEAVRLLSNHGKMTCSNLGAALTGKPKVPQASAREGGRTLHALQRRGLVQREFDGWHWQWSLTRAGRDAGREPTKES